MRLQGVRLQAMRGATGRVSTGEAPCWPGPHGEMAECDPAARGIVARSRWKRRVAAVCAAEMVRII